MIKIFAYLKRNFIYFLFTTTKKFHKSLFILFLYALHLSDFSHYSSATNY